MRLRRKQSTLRYIVVALGLCFCNSVCHAQGPAPAVTKNRLQLARLRLSAVTVKPPQKASDIQTNIGVAVSGAVGNSFISDPKFAACVGAGKSCKWDADPWPFAGMGVDVNTGVISGTPTTAGRVKVHVVATEPAGTPYADDVVVEVTPAKVAMLTTDAEIPAYPVGEAINEELQAYGGSGPFIWSLDSSAPSLIGVTLKPSGVLSGIASTAGTYKLMITVKDALGNPSDSTPVVLVINAAPDCGNAKYGKTNYFDVWAPLSRDVRVHPLENNPLVPTKHLPTENDVQCFYGTSGLVSVAGKIQYLYGFGGGANTISADLVSVQMPAPIGTQVSFGSSVTAGGTGTPSSGSTTTNQPPTLTAALQSVEAGGNFYIHALYPVEQYANAHLSVYTFLDPKAGFSFNGFAGQATLSQGSEQYFSFPIETYASYDGIGHAGGVYFDYRGGLESVPGSFAKSAGLSQHNFMLNQLSFGFNFAGLFRVGVQRFFGPSAAFNAASASASSFNKWHLVLQLSPTKGS
jgi:hypothetical protein